MKMYKFLLMIIVCLNFIKLDAMFDNDNFIKSSASDFSYKEIDQSDDRMYDYDNSQLEFKVGYFSFYDKNLRQVYNHGGYELQLSYAYPIVDHLNIYRTYENS